MVLLEFVIVDFDVCVWSNNQNNIMETSTINRVAKLGALRALKTASVSIVRKYWIWLNQESYVFLLFLNMFDHC